MPTDGKLFGKFREVLQIRFEVGRLAGFDPQLSLDTYKLKQNGFAKIGISR